MHESLSPKTLLDLVTRTTSDVIMVLDREIRIQYINFTAPPLTVEGVIGTSMFDYLSPDQHAHIRTTFERAAQTQEPDRYISYYEGGDGTSRWEARIGPIVVDGEVTGFVSIASDVTERHEAAAHRERLFELSVDLFCLAGFDGYFKRVNPAWTRTLGYTEEELLSRPFVEFIVEEDIEPTRKAFSGLIERGENLTGFRNRYRRKDGEPRTLEWTSTADPTQDLVIAVARDVTEQQGLEEQLRQAQKMDAVGQLAGGVAHDFNNLLQAILGNVHFARSAAPSPELAGFLNQIESAAERAASLTKQLLAFSRQQPATFVPVDLNVLTRELLGLLRRVIPESIEVDFVAGHQLAMTAGDPSQIEQILMNLCLNARDAMPNGGRITIETENILINGAYRESHPWAKPGRYVLLTVTDTGAGIPDEIQDKVFEPFFTTKEQGEGSGLGLSTVYGIVQQHEGMLHLYSELGQGTTFKIYLPVTMRLASQVGAKLDPLAEGGAEVILIAEDERLVRDVVVRILERGGYEVLVAANGREAVKLCRAHDAIALALLDVVMPELNGPQAAAQIRELRPDLPVLFSSGYSDASRFAASSLPEGAEVLNKPYRVEELLQKVRETLNAAQRPD